MKIAFIGYNVVGRHIKNILEQKYSNIEYLYFDDIILKQGAKNSYSFIEYKKFLNQNINFIITLGYKHLDLRRQIISELTRLNESLLNVIDENTIIAKDAIIGNGVIIYSGVVIGNNVNIADGVLLHNAVVVSHNSYIGHSTYISPNATICGNVQIKECCFIGANTSVANDIIIDKKSIIGIGSVITKNLGSGTNGIGNPFKTLKDKIKLK